MLQLSSLVSTGATIKGLATQIPQQKQLLGQVQQPSILNIPKITPKEQSTQAQVTPAIFKSVNKSRYDQPSLSIPQISPAPAETPKQNPIYPIIFSRDPAPKKQSLNQISLQNRTSPLSFQAGILALEQKNIMSKIQQN